MEVGGVGDKVSSGTVWQKIGNSTVITSVHGRTGAVAAAEGDYDLTKLSDVTISSPVANQFLKYNGTTWVNAVESDPSVSAFAKAALPNCASGQVLKSDGTSFTGTAPAFSIRGDGDNDTGIYTPSANVLGITAGGKDGLRINTATNAVNYVAITPSATGASPIISPEGLYRY